MESNSIWAITYSLSVTLWFGTKPVLNLLNRNDSAKCELETMQIAAQHDKVAQA